MSTRSTVTFIDDNLHEDFSYTDRNGLPVRVEEKLHAVGRLYFKDDCHWHREIEVLTVSSGEMDCYVNGRIYSLAAGGGIVINSNRMHYSIWKKNSGCEYSLFQFDTSLVSSDPIIRSKYIEPLTADSSADVILLDTDKADILSDFRYAINLCRESEPGYELKLQSVISSVWLKLFVYAQQCGQLAAGGRGNDALKNMIGYIKENYTQKISLEDIAASGAVSRTTCHNIFKENLGCSPVSFLIEYRIRQSLYMLQDKNLSITEISRNCGFASSCYYGETFKKIMGCTPSQWRTGQKRQ